MLIAILFILHFVADFLLQSPKMGKEKSEKPITLFYHILTHFLIFLCILYFLVGRDRALLMSASNAIVHGIIDWNIWRLYKATVWYRRTQYLPTKLKSDRAKKAWLKCNFQFWSDHWFGVFLGFDQLLHGLCLILIYYGIRG